MTKFTAERIFPVMESELIALREDAERYRFALTHNATTRDGYEIGIAKVKFSRITNAPEFLWCLSDSSEIDQAINDAKQRAKIKAVEDDPEVLARALREFRY